MENATPTPLPADKAEQLLGLVATLAEHTQDVPPEIVLGALLTMFRAIALHFTCCTPSAAGQCATVALELTRACNLSGPEAGTPVH